VTAQMGTAYTPRKKKTNIVTECCQGRQGNGANDLKAIIERRGTAQRLSMASQTNLVFTNSVGSTALRGVRSIMFVRIFLFKEYH
jgi:hypothetical protein